MRWVDRGPEPAGVAGYARQFTQGWVDYFQNGVGGRPTDSHWQEFRPRLGERTDNICWYCERKCFADSDVGGQSPSLDHFRPISRFPHLAYEWTNWVFSCQRCNVDNKQDRWPTDGFVDPCDSDISERPEQYFTYDWLTGEVLPREDLSENARRKARDTIRALDLNRRDVLELRFDWVWQFFFDLFDENTVPVSARDLFIRTYAGQPIKPAEFSGMTGMFVEQLRRAGSI